MTKEESNLQEQELLLSDLKSNYEFMTREQQYWQDKKILKVESRIASLKRRIQKAFLQKRSERTMQTDQNIRSFQVKLKEKRTRVDEINKLLITCNSSQLQELVAERNALLCDIRVLDFKREQLVTGQPILGQPVSTDKINPRPHPVSFNDKVKHP